MQREGAGLVEKGHMVVVRDREKKRVMALYRNAFRTLSCKLGGRVEMVRVGERGGGRLKNAHVRQKKKKEKRRPLGGGGRRPR